MKTLIIIRGLPGSGKSTLAGLLAEHNVAADDFFDIYFEGRFEAQLLPAAHKWCKDLTEEWMEDGMPVIAVHNTFTQEWEMQPYFDLAEEYDYRVATVVVENRHGSNSVHDVPEKTIEKMRRRFNIKLGGKD